MSRFIIAPSASRDLDSIADYFLTRNVEAGEKLFQEFNKKCQNLAKFPQVGRKYNHIREGLRGLPLEGTSFCIGLLMTALKLFGLLAVARI